MTYAFPSILIVAFMVAVVVADWLRGRTPRPRAGVAVKARHASPDREYAP